MTLFQKQWCISGILVTGVYYKRCFQLVFTHKKNELKLIRQTKKLMKCLKSKNKNSKKQKMSFALDWKE